MKFQVAQWEAVQAGTRIEGREIIDTEYRDTESEALELAQQIIEEQPDGIRFVTVARVDENGEALDDEYMLDEAV